MPFATTDDGTKLWYHLEGSAGAPTIVLSNSLGTTAAMWDAQMPALLKHFQVLRTDTRGHGPAGVGRMAAMLRATPREGYAAACEAIREMDQREELATIRARVLVIAGTFDQATPPAGGRQIVDGIPGARYVELATAHLSN